MHPSIQRQKNVQTIDAVQVVQLDVGDDLRLLHLVPLRDTSLVKSTGLVKKTRLSWCYLCSPGVTVTHQSLSVLFPGWTVLLPGLLPSGHRHVYNSSPGNHLHLPPLSKAWSILPSLPVHCSTLCDRPFRCLFVPPRLP